MAKKQNKNIEKKEQRKRILVALYEDEWEKVSEKLEIEESELSGKKVREYFGLKAVGKKSGINTQLRKLLNEKLKTATEDEKQDLLVDLSENDDLE